MTTRAQALIPVTIAAVIIGVVGIISIPADHKLDSTEFPHGAIKLDGKLLDVQIADTRALQVRGLMFQDPLPYDAGMLFIFDSTSPHSLWMMNVQFSLDMIWFDADLRTVHIEENVPPCKSALETVTCPSYFSESDSMYVLEATAGFVKMHNIAIGSVLELVST